MIQELLQAHRQRQELSGHSQRGLGATEINMKNNRMTQKTKPERIQITKQSATGLEMISM